jgi:hypothetical protein
MARYDPNDLALDTFTKNIIARELAAIIARPFAPPENWVFSLDNRVTGDSGAEMMQYKPIEEIRRGLAHLGSDLQREGQGIRHRAGKKEGSDNAVQSLHV